MNRFVVLSSGLPPLRPERARGSLARRGIPIVLGLILAAGSASPGHAQRRPEEPRPLRRSPDAPPWPKDFEVGLEAARSIESHIGLVESDSLMQRVTDIGYRVASQSGHPEYLFTFHILDIPDPNAEALPGGFIFLTKGILDLDLSDAALANLIGHEIGHVTARHFARGDRISGILSLLQTAALVAALVAVPSSSSGGYDYDETAGAYRTSASGKAAAVQGTAIFGGVFRELLQRGYSRGFEVEADEIGRRLAARAGYPVSGDVELMQDLSQHVYEDREYGYWRTHPYFEERMQKALAATDPGGAPPNEAEMRAYREQVQNRLSALAGSIQDEKTALFLYRSALRAGPGGASSLEVAHKVLQKRSERQRRKKEVLRSYGPLIADYDSLLTLAAGYSGNLDSEIQSLKAERNDLEQERDELYPRSVEIVDDPEAGVQFLELFVENFPDDPRTVQIRFRLAEHYRLLDRADDAAIELDQLLRDLPAEAPSPVVPASAPPPDELASVSLDPENAVLPRAWGRRKASSGDENPADDWKTRSLSALRRILPETRELTTNQRIVDETPSDSVRTWARTHLETLAAGLDSLEIGSRFLEAYPKSDLADVVQQKVEKLAETRYYQARLYESLHRFQAALDQYNALILLAPGTRAAQLAREGIERVQTLAGG